MRRRELSFLRCRGLSAGEMTRPSPLAEAAVLPTEFRGRRRWHGHGALLLEQGWREEAFTGIAPKPPPPSVAKSVSTMRLYEAWNAVDCGGPYPGRMLGDIMRCLRRAPARAQPPGAPRARRRDHCAPSSPGSRARVSLRQSPGPRPCRAGDPRASARSHARTP